MDPQVPVDPQGPVSPAEPILRNDPSLTDDARADLFDIFHGSKDPEALVRVLQPLAVPDDTKRRLVAAKSTMSRPDPTDKISLAATKVSQMDPQVLELAEAHPTVFKTMVAALQEKEKPEEKTAPKEKEAELGPGAGPVTNPLEQPPRPDGQPHFPAIPPKHRRILASDSSIHDIPEDRLEDARKIDPLLHVLNPDV